MIKNIVIGVVALLLLAVTGFVKTTEIPLGSGVVVPDASAAK